MLLSFEAPVWLWPSLAAVLGLSLLAFRPSLPTGVVIGAALLAVSAFIGARAAPGLADYSKNSGEVEVPFYDLTQGPLDPEARGHVRIRGHLIAEPKLAEYAVAQGKSPDQNAPPFATVRLLLPTPEFAVPNEGRYIAARVLVSQGSERQDGADIVEGVLRPLPEELINPLFGGHEAPEGNKGGLLLDAGEQPQSSDLAIDLALTLLAAFLALMAWRNAFGAVSQEESATPKEPENARA